MSVRGGKNKILLYVAGAFGIAIVILLYHNASQRLEDVEKSYERCHMNEESLSAQLQVILEYKVRLEKSLQQEKSDHAQSKEELQNKLEEERQLRERENLESINKFTALQQQYKLLQSQHEDVDVEFNKLRQLQLTEIEDKSRLETQIQSLKNELKLLKDSKDSDSELWKVKYTKLEKDNELLKRENQEKTSRISTLEKENGNLQSHVPQGNKTPSGPSGNKLEDNLPVPLPYAKRSPENASSFSKSSTVANKADREVFQSGNNVYVNTSTPMINPEAVQSQDKMLHNVLPVPQPKQESSSKRDEPMYENKDGVGAKPDEMGDKVDVNAPAQGVLPMPGILNQFAVQSYKERLKQGERNDNGGEVGDEGEPIVKHVAHNAHWRDGDADGQQVVRHPVANNEIHRNQMYQYQADYDARKEEDDDDDVDQIDYPNANEKNNAEEKDKPAAEPLRLKLPMADKRDSIMVNPK